MPAIDPHEGVTVPGSLAELDDVELHPYYGETAPAVMSITPPGGTKHRLGLARAAGTAPAAAAGAKLGTAPPALVVVTGSTDGRGSITFGTGTTPPAAEGDLLTVTFATAFLSRPIVKVSSKDALGMLSPSEVTLTGFKVRCTATLAASQPNTTFELQYEVTS